MLWNEDYFERLREHIGLPEEAVGEFIGTALRIESDEKALAEFGSIVDSVSLPDCENYLSALESANGFAERYGINPFTLHAVMLIVFFERLEALYGEAGLSSDIFYNTAADLTCKVRECMDVKGVPGVFVAYWYKGFFNMTRFGIGRFEYEIKPIGCTAVFDDGETVPEGTECLNFHIPSSGEPLADEARYDSYRRAFFFFDKLRKNGRTVFICHSWLLFPDNREFLPPRSNILRFANDFTFVEREEQTEFEDAWRIFGAAAEGPAEDLPEETSLQRSVKERLVKGRPLGLGLGAFRFDGEKIY